MVVELSDTTLLVCGAVGLVWGFVFLILVPFDPLLTARKRGQVGSNSARADEYTRRFQFGIAQMIGLVASAAVISLFSSFLFSVVWSIHRQPTDSEMAEHFRQEAAKWTRLAAEFPLRAKEYLRNAEKSSQTAERFDLKSKAMNP
jgi:hypothetical protein